MTKSDFLKVTFYTKTLFEGKVIHVLLSFRRKIHLLPKFTYFFLEESFMIITCVKSKWVLPRTLARS